MLNVLSVFSLDVFATMMVDKLDVLLSNGCCLVINKEENKAYICRN